MAGPVRTTCPYCGVGCGIVAQRSADGSVSVKGDEKHPANFGRLCSKGSALGETVSLEGRLLYPQIAGRRAGWDDALDTIAARFSETIRDHGPDSVAFYVSGQILTEDYYVANKLMKGFIGSANIYTKSRLCMSSSVAGHRRAFGSDTVPGSYDDLEQADLIVIVGANPAWCHPVLYQRIAAARQERPDMKVVLIDPRRTMSADIADMHLAIAPDGDVALFSGLLGHLAQSSALDMDYISRHTEGFERALEITPTLEEAARLTGLTESELHQFYHLFAATGKTVTLYSQGVNQSSMGTDKVNAIINCHLATGRMGRPGMGPFSLTGQPNAMGGREVGGLANMLAAHMDIEDPSHRDIVRRFWNAPFIAEKPGLKAVDLFQAVAEGKVKALWIMGTNPVVSMPQADAVRAALKSCPFVVVSDVVSTTDTTEFANILLPSANWGEKSGTVTNSERRISRQRGFLPLPGAVRPDWWQMAEVGKRMGFVEAFNWSQPIEVFAEYAAMTAFENGGSRDLDIGAYAQISALDYDRLEPFQWPQPSGGAPATTRFFADGGFFTSNRKARFIAARPVPPQRVSEAFPLVLNTGRIRDQWHTMTRTGKSERLSSHIGEPFAEFHPDDAAKAGIAAAHLVIIESPHGRVLVRALITPKQRKGSIFVPMHWSDQFASIARIGSLVASVVAPYSGQPASKHVAVRAMPFAAKIYGLALCTEKPASLTHDYWAMAKVQDGWKVELALGNDIDDIEAFARQLFAIGQQGNVTLLTYSDRATSVHRVVAFNGANLVGILFLAPEPVAVSRSWAAEQLTIKHEEPGARWLLAAGRAEGDRPDKGAIICSCFGIGAKQIASAARQGCTTVQAIGKTLQAGTNCGSCKSEISQIIAENAPLMTEQNLENEPA